MRFEHRDTEADARIVDRVWRTCSDTAGTMTSAARTSCQLILTRTRGRLLAGVRGPETTATTAPVPPDAKAVPGGELQVHGSWQLVQALHRAELVDRYRLLQYPVVVGTGKRLFSTGSTPVALEVAEGDARVLPNGVVSLTLTPTTFGMLTAGTYAVEQGRSTAVTH